MPNNIEYIYTYLPARYTSAEHWNANTDCMLGSHDFRVGCKKFQKKFYVGKHNYHLMCNSVCLLAGTDNKPCAYLHE